MGVLAISQAGLYGVGADPSILGALNLSAFFTPAVVTGGTLTSDETYYYRTFTSSDTLTVSDASLNVDYLIVAGGGGGGSNAGGSASGAGGGAGGLLQGNTNLPPEGYAITVGGGGAGGSPAATDTKGSLGSNSAAFSLTSVGGGGGGTRTAALSDGLSGGSGGGQGAHGTSTTPAAGTVGQGNSGGLNGYSGSTGQDNASGGGGGAGQVGQNGLDNAYGGDGGDGLEVFGNYYAGGGGGGISNLNGTRSFGIGGIGGGGNGGLGNNTNTTSAAQSGATNLGGGGGGAGATGHPGGNGGSGVVVVRYLKSAVLPPDIVPEGLILHLDAANADSYSGTGTTWFDLSGNGNDVQLYNSPTFSDGTFTFNGTNQYARTIANLNLSSYDSVTVEIDLKIITSVEAMAWEHTTNWNTNTGGFGLVPNSTGLSYSLNLHHTNHNGGSGAVNYPAVVDSQWATHTNIFSKISDSTGRLSYVNGILINFSTGSTVTSGGSFANAVMYFASRGGANSFGNYQIGAIRVYGRKLLASEVLQNFNVVRTNYGLSDPAARGLFGGGIAANPSYNIIDYITIATLGNATDFGDLTVGRQALGACSSYTRAVFSGGALENYPTFIGQNTIDYVTIATTGNATDFGDATLVRWNVSGCSSSTRGLFAGGASGTPPGTATDVIDYVTIATLGNAIDFGNLTVARNWNSAACSSPTRGVFGGGVSAADVNLNVIDYVTIATTGNATDFGDLTAARQGLTSCSSSTRGLFAGGNLNVIDYVTIATTGNATDFGDLTVSRTGPSGASSSTRGFFGGGSNPTNVIDYVTIATTGNATDFGDLTVSRVNSSGASNAHGGLGQI